MEIFYLKYRPQTLDELIGQEEVKKTLLKAYQNDKLSHAYLMVGPRGTGKTSTARILAKMVNCQQRQAPCNKCDICGSITDGSNLDLIEIDAASNRGIEDIRTLRERIKLAPTQAKKKIYIIDEVHMLTMEAFNALLKTLEEPPAHVLFILATTDANKVPQTILSRVQRLDFELATSKEITEALRRIVQNEKIDIEEEALKLLAKRADGSFRDGVKLLDQAASLGDKITSATLFKTLKSSQFDDQIDLLEKIADKKGSESLLKINKQIETGVDVKQQILSLQDLMRSLMLIKNGVGELVSENWTAQRWEKLVELSEKFNDHDLIKGLDCLQKAFEKLKFASIPVLPLEIAVLEICGSAESIKPSVIPNLSEESSNLNKQIATLRQAQGKLPRNDSTETLISSDAPNNDIQKLKEKWTFVLETIRPYNFSLEALLRSVSISECTDSTVIMEVPYSFHQRILEAPKNRDLLAGVFSEILGRSIRVSTILGNRPQRKQDLANIEVAADDEIIRIASEIFNSETN